MVLPNVPGPKLPSTASPDLELLPPSSFMARGAGGTARVSPPLGLSLSLLWCSSSLKPLLLFFLEFLGPWTSLGALHIRPVCSMHTKQPANTPTLEKCLVVGQLEEPYRQTSSRAAGLGGQEGCRGLGWEEEEMRGCYRAPPLAWTWHQVVGQPGALVCSGRCASALASHCGSDRLWGHFSFKPPQG